MSIVNHLLVFPTQGMSFVEHLFEFFCVFSGTASYIGVSNTGAFIHTHTHTPGSGVAFVHHVSFNITSTCFTWKTLFDTGHAYYAVEKCNVSMIVFRTVGFAPHLL